MNMKKEIWSLIGEYEVITIFGHIVPDGDCYGSQIGLKNAILQEFPHKKVFAIGSGLKRFIPLIGAMDEVSDETIVSSLAIVLDVSTKNRIEDQRFSMAKELIKIDHHVPQEHFGCIDCVDTSCVSCSELVTSILYQNGIKPKEQTARALYLGMVTDSNRFLYAPTSSNTFKMASYLFESGFNPEPLYDILYAVDEKILKVKGFIYLNYARSMGGATYMVFDKKTIADLNIDYNTAASLVNSISGTAPIWVFFAESEEGEVRVEFRSKGYDVQKIALQFGGGGHLQASGCRLSKLEQYHDVLKLIDETLEEKQNV